MPRPIAKLFSVMLILALAACGGAPPPSPPPAAAKQAAQPAKPAAKAPNAPSSAKPAAGKPAEAKPTPGAQVAPGGSAQVAVILPLSGPQALLGNALLNAAQMALFDLADGELSLIPYDSKGTAEGAAAAMSQAAAGHADIVVGPLFAAEVRAVTPIARNAHIPVLALSADRSVAGPGIYVLGFLPGPQALRVAGFAAAQGKTRQAILAPSNDYGRAVVNELTNGARELGAAIGPIEYYDPQALDVSNPLKRLLAARKGDDPGFDALFLPDDGGRLRRAAEQWVTQAQAANIDPARVTLLGTMLWEDSRAAEVPALAGGWYPLAPTAGFAEFSKRYAKAFAAAPPRLASLAYDAFAIAAVLNKQAAHDFSPGILTNPQGFSGIDGLFRLQIDGRIDRAYSVREVVPNGVSKEASPAPLSYGG